MSLFPLFPNVFFKTALMSLLGVEIMYFDIFKILMCCKTAATILRSELCFLPKVCFPPRYYIAHFQSGQTHCH